MGAFAHHDSLLLPAVHSGLSGDGCSLSSSIRARMESILSCILQDCCMLCKAPLIRPRPGGLLHGPGLGRSSCGPIFSTPEMAVGLWDVASGRQLRGLPDHKGSLRFVAFSPDGKVLASGSTSSGVVRLWDTETGTHLRQASPPP